MYLRTFSVLDVGLKRSHSKDAVNETDSEESSDDDSGLMKPAFVKSTPAQANETISKSNKIQKVKISEDDGPSTSGVTSSSNSSMQTKQPQENQTTARYNNYVDMLIWDSDEEDAEMAAAIQASLEEQSKETVGKSSAAETVPLEVIKAFVDKNIDTNTDDYVNSIIINRKNVLSSTLRAIERKQFSFNKEVFVTFSGEDGVDAGGPKREYFRLLMLSLKNLGVFQGNWFSHNLQLLHNNRYELAGKLVAWSILQGGPGLKHLSQDAYCVMNDLPYENKHAIQAVGDRKMQDILSELENCTDDEMFDAFKDSKADVIADHGYTSIYTCDRSKKGDIQHSLLKQALVFSVHAEIDQFKKGLNSIGGFGDIVMGSAEVFNVVLSKDNNEKLSFLSMKKLYRVNYSEDGSNDKENEEKTMYCFELFLQDLEDNEVEDLSLNDLLIFITGADSIPPLGFDDLIFIAFYDQEDQVKRLPYASTCSLSLYLPRAFEDAQEFKHLMSMALIHGVGFGKC